MSSDLVKSENLNVEKLDKGSLSGEKLRSVFSNCERMTLAELMEALCFAGEPKLFKHKSGWVCCVDMHVPAAGSKFEIRSEFGCSSPVVSARQCSRRVLETLKQWS